MAKIKNIVDLRNDLLEKYDKMVTGEIARPMAKEISNMTGKIMMSVRLQIDYNNYRGECKEIEFLKVK